MGNPTDIGLVAETAQSIGRFRETLQIVLSFGRPKRLKSNYRRRRRMKTVNDKSNQFLLLSKTGLVQSLWRFPVRFFDAGRSMFYTSSQTVGHLGRNFKINAKNTSAKVEKLKIGYGLKLSNVSIKNGHVEPSTTIQINDLQVCYRFQKTKKYIFRENYFLDIICFNIIVFSIIIRILFENILKLRV